MRHFLRDCIGFTAILCLLSLGLGWYPRRQYYDPYYRFDPNFESYLLADSHGDSLGNNLAPFGVYNFAWPSDSYVDTARKAQKLLEIGKVRRLYLSADFHMLAVSRENYSNGIRSIRFAENVDLDDWREFVRLKLRNRITLFDSSSRDLLVLRVRGAFHDPNESTKTRSWAALSPEERAARAALRVSHQLPESNSSVELKSALVRILEMCAAKGVDVVGIKFPVTREYLEDTEAIDLGAEAVFHRYGFRVVDWRELFLDQPELFRDQDHLNAEGAERFAARFARWMTTEGIRSEFAGETGL